MNVDEQKIRGAIDDFVRAYNSGNVERLLTIYSADFVDMSEGERTLVGAEARDDTESRLRDTFARYIPHLTVQTDELEIVGDRAFDRGTLCVELTPKDSGNKVRVERRFIEIWRREGAEWRVIRAMDNSASATNQSLDFR